MNTRNIDMGKVYSQHNMRGRVRSVLVFFVLLAICVSIFAYLGAEFLKAMRGGPSLGTPITGELWLLPILCISPVVIIAVLSVVGLINTIKNWNLKALVHENGIAITNDNKIQNILWQDISKLWQKMTAYYTNGVYQGTIGEMKIELSTGETVKLGNGFTDPETLFGKIQENVSAHLLPAYMTKIDDGECINFGPIDVDVHGFYYDRKELKLNEVDGVYLDKGIFRIRKKDKLLNWAKIKVSQVPNVYIFMELVKVLSALGQAESSPSKMS